MKKLVVLVLFALMAVSSFAALYPEYKSPFEFPVRKGVERVTHYDPRVSFARVDTNIYLSPPGPDIHKGVGRGGYAPMYARGFARIGSSAWYGFPRAFVTLTTKDLPASSEKNVVFETWLVDQETGYRLSLGTFTTTMGGIGEMWFNSDTYFDPYDWIEITVEPFDDIDLSPGPVALIGRVPSPVFFDPAPKSSKMVTNVYTNY